MRRRPLRRNNPEGAFGSLKHRRFGSVSEIPTSYTGLCALYLPRPIHDDSEQASAYEMMVSLAGFQGLNSDQEDYLRVLAEFVDEYDSKTSTEGGEEPTGVEMLR